MRKKYQSKEHKSNDKFEAIRRQELLVRVPLPMADWRKSSYEGNLRELRLASKLTPYLKLIFYAVPL